MTNSRHSGILPSWWTAFPWILAVAVLGVGFAVWFQNMGFSFHIVSLYQVFPVIGIWAWSIIWTHYIIGETRRLIPSLPKHMPYHRASTVFVLFTILLHPTILALEQYRQGEGFPPTSYVAYAGPAAMPYIALGMLGLSLFLFYEVIVRFKTNAFVQKHWWLVNLTQSVAMIAIFRHALVLGSELHSGWFRSYWIVLGLLLAPCLIHQHWDDWKHFGEKAKA